jgi:hypothetical protein
MERGLPIGCAPNVHVSLVMLPEECASLSSRSFPFRELKRQAVKAMAGRLIGRRLAAADSRRRSGSGYAASPAATAIESSI